MAETTEVDQEEHRLDCLARYIAGKLQEVPPGDQREARFQKLIGKGKPDTFINAMRARIRKQWQNGRQTKRSHVR